MFIISDLNYIPKKRRMSSFSEKGELRPCPRWTGEKSVLTMPHFDTPECLPHVSELTPGFVKLLRPAFPVVFLVWNGQTPQCV